MRFLVPVGGDIGAHFGVLTSYRHRGVPAGIAHGALWAGDNCAFTGQFDGPRFLTWLEGMTPHRATCLFVAVPDVVGDVAATLRLWREWQSRMAGWPLAYVAQDGSETHAIPDDADAVFIGGSTAWKLSRGAEAVIMAAQARGLHVHIGRVNYWKRYRHFRLMPGSEAFTCDGTRTRFDGRDKTLAAWRGYMAASGGLFGGDCGGEFAGGVVRASGDGD